jgi:hypothetical protein
MALGIAYPFGLRDVKITPISNATTEAYGTVLDLPAARVLSFTEAESFEDLRGDDAVITSRGTGPTIAWDLEGGGVHLDVLKAIIGGTVIDSGVTPNQMKSFRKKATDARPFFKAEGQVMSDTGGDVHALLFRCKATGDVEYNFSDGNWVLTKCSGAAYPSVEATRLDALYDIVFNETVTAIPLFDAVPGATFPANPNITASDAPNAAKLTGLGYIARPQTAWTVGQKITVGTYDFNWSGTAWAAGAHA